MSGVKNLRAMFEQKTGDSPPDDRGRSPPSSLKLGDSPTPSQSPRPLSKIRTNFVAIEKDGRIGLQREPSRESVSVSSRRPSNETDFTTPAAVSEKSDVFAETMAQNAAAFKTNLAKEPIPESPGQPTPPSKSSPKKGTQTPDIVPNSNPDKVTDEEETKTKLTAADPTTAAAVQPNKDASKPATNGGAKSGTHSTKPKTSTIPTTGKTASKAPKSPTISHAPKHHTTETAKAPARATIAKPTTPKKSVSPAKKPTSLEPSPVIRPKAKSPTRPVKLPPGLTTHTASSASKTGAAAPAHVPARQTLSRASGNHARPHSRASTTAPGAGSKTLRRQSSTISRPMPSIGPPPKPVAKDHPVPKKEAHVDESFLARMMRPTQASSSKTAEKVPTTPPKKHGAPTVVKKSSAGKVGEANAKKAAAKLSESTKTKDSPTVKRPAAKGSVKAGPSAKHVAPVVAQTASAGAAIKAAAVSKDTAVTPVVEKSEPQAAETVVEEMAASSDKETQESEMVEQAKLTNGTNGTHDSETIPVVSENPQEVKDVEDVIQEAPADAVVDDAPVEDVTAEASKTEEVVKTESA